MVSAEVIKVLDFVDTDNPVLASEGLLDRIQDRTLGGETGATNSVGRLSWGEQAAEVVVRHLVPTTLLEFWILFDIEK